MSDYTFRAIEKEDYHKGFMDMINIFTRPPVAAMTFDPFCKQLDAMIAQNSQVFVAVWKETMVVGTAKILLEYKLHNHGARMGHVEDVVVHPEHRGKGIAQQLVNLCLRACQEADCYKVVLSCKEDLLPLYGKLGFKETGRTMTVYRNST